jgi:endonuclease/exonuclease/phosphatase (EEP) superfamily protein YafD
MGLVMRLLQWIACLLIGVALCGIVCTVIWALRQPTIHSTPVPASATLGAPDAPVRIVSYNILHNQRGRDGVIAEILRTNPDVIFLQELERRDLDAMAERLSIPNDNLHIVYNPSVNLAGRGSWGNAILSKPPLYEAASIPNPGGGSFGVWAYAIVNDKKFMIACVHLSATWNANPHHVIESSNNRYKELTNLRNAWTLAGSPPISISFRWATITS